MQVVWHIRNVEDDLRKRIENKHFIMGERENRASTVSDSSESSDGYATNDEFICPRVSTPSMNWEIKIVFLNHQ